MPSLRICGDPRKKQHKSKIYAVCLTQTYFWHLDYPKDAVEAPIY